MPRTLASRADHDTTAPAARPVTGVKDVPALARAHALLDLVAASRGPLSISEIARSLVLPKSTVHGLCATLVNLGLLARRGETGFKIGPHVMRWAHSFLANVDIAAEFTTLLDRLDIVPNETINLALLDGRDVVYVACRNSESPFALTFRIGMRMPAPFAATGKAILSTMDDEAIHRLMAGRWPTLLTPASTPDIEALLSEMAATRARGFSIDNAQIRDGMFCVGTTIRNAAGEIAAGLAVSVLTGALDQATLDRMVATLHRIAGPLSARLGSAGAPTTGTGDRL